MSKTERVLGLDGEMSGSDIEDGHKLIQIGVAVDSLPDGSRLPVPDLFCSLIGWAEEELPWSERAEQVHNISYETVLSAPPASEVDDQLYRWLVEHGANEAARHTLIATGFNVGAFDFPFVRAALPRSARLFSRTYADLNPYCIGLGSSVGRLIGGTPSRSGWKRRIKDAGRRLVASTGRTQGEHDAGTDALMALGAWREIEETLARLDTEAAEYRRILRDRRAQQARSSQEPTPATR